VQCKEALRLSPGDVSNYSNLGATYLGLNRLDEAKATFDQALAHNLDSEFLRGNLYLLAFLQGDEAGMAKQVAWRAGKPGDEDLMLSAQSDTEAYYGRLREARDYSRRAVDSALRADSQEAAAYWQVSAALREAELGNKEAAKKGVEAALGLSPGRNVKVVAALTFARIGDISRAKEIVRDSKRIIPPTPC
jgi:eukaryotic-like serine/threonine-protein kinase